MELSNDFDQIQTILYCLSTFSRIIDLGYIVDKKGQTVKLIVKELTYRYFIFDVFIIFIKTKQAKPCGHIDGV